MPESTFPRRFGRYILLDKVNSGGMAEVYRAKVTGTDNFQRIVAIKCMLSNLAEDQEFATMFVDEARLAAQLNHGNIVQIYELGRHEEQLYIAMELVNGHDLRNTTKRARKLGKRLGVGFVAYILSKAAEALDYAHNKLSLEGTPLNLVHRDVSPQNILVSYDGEVKVVDFGIAKAEHRATETRAGTLKGKFAYMAPEQVVGDATDRRADIFALGAVLYEAATGRPLFYGDTDLAILEKVRNATLPNLEEHLAHAPAQLCKVIRRACALKPEERYQSALDLAEDLAPVLISRGNLFGPKNARTTMRVLYEEEWSELPQKLKEYAAAEVVEEAEGRGRTQIFGALLNTTGDVPLVSTQEIPRHQAPPPAAPAAAVVEESEPIASAATELFSPKDLEARASATVPPAKEADQTGPLDADPEPTATSTVEEMSEARPEPSRPEVRGRPEPSGRIRPEPSGRSRADSVARLRPEPSGRIRAAGWLRELEAAPTSVRYALIGLGGACVVTLLALVVVLAGRGGERDVDETAPPAMVTVEPIEDEPSVGTVVEEIAEAKPADDPPTERAEDEPWAATDVDDPDSIGGPADALDDPGAQPTSEAVERPKRRFAWVNIDSKGVAARVLVDGKEIGRTPIKGYRVRAGRHRVKFIPVDNSEGRLVEVHISPRYTEDNPMELSLKLR